LSINQVVNWALIEGGVVVGGTVVGATVVGATVVGATVVGVACVTLGAGVVTRGAVAAGCCAASEFFALGEANVPIRPIPNTTMMIQAQSGVFSHWCVHQCALCGGGSGAAWGIGGGAGGGGDGGAKTMLMTGLSVVCANRGLVSLASVETKYLRVQGNRHKCTTEWPT